jgi:hypothetical protein
MNSKIVINNSNYIWKDLLRRRHIKTPADNATKANKEMKRGSITPISRYAGTV